MGWWTRPRLWRTLPAVEGLYIATLLVDSKMGRDWSEPVMVSSRPQDRGQ